MSGRLIADENSEDDDFDDDDYEHVTATTSRLSNLFAGSSAIEGNSSLIYKAPKPPTVKEEVIPSSETTKVDDDTVAIKVLYAVPVHVFLLQNGQYVPQGKLGLAILGNKARKDFKLLIYLHNKQPIGQASLKFESQIIVQKNNYVQFHDDRQQFWSIAFDAEVHLVDFLKWYLASKAVIIGDKQKQIFSLDVADGEGQIVGVGDSIEIEYTEYLIEDGPQLTEFNGSNANRPLRIKIGKGKVPKGWEEGLVGMKKSGKRLFVIPPDLGYSGRETNASFPTNVPLMVHVILKRVKFASSSSSSKNGVRKFSSESVSSKQNINANEIQEYERDIVREPSVTNNSADEEQHPHQNTTAAAEDATETSRKAELVSRMAKIGHPMMPLTSVPLSSHKTEDTTPAAPTNVTVSAEQQQMQKPTVPPRQIHELAVVCADLTLVKPTVTSTLAGGVSKSQSEGTISQRAQQAASLPSAEQQFMPPVSVPMAPMQNSPYMYPYAMPYQYHPYFLMPPSGAAATGGGTPFSLTPDLVASSTSSLDRQNVMIVEEIQKSHVQLQETLTKLLNDTLTTFSQRMTDINGNFDSKLNKLHDTLVLPEDTTSRSSDVVVSKLDNLELLIKNIGDKNSPTEDDVQNSSNNLTTVEEKLQMCTEQLNSMQTAISELKNALTNDFSKAPLVEKLSAIDERLTALQNLKEKMDCVQEDLRSNKEWNVKYEKLKSQALVIKEKYEERINLLTEHLHRLQQQLEIVKKDKSSTYSEEQKVKKIMNTFYKSICAKILPSQTYMGDDVQQIILDLVKECTLRVINKKEEENNSSVVDKKEEDIVQPKSEPSSPTSLTSSSPRENHEKEDETVEKVVDNQQSDPSKSKDLTPMESDQEFYDAAYSTPPRNDAKNETEYESKSSDDVNNSYSNKSDKDQQISGFKTPLTTYPLIETVPPPLPDNDDEQETN